MPTYTSNYNLLKPLDTEFYNVNDQNGNMDIIDSTLNFLKNNKGTWLGDSSNAIPDLNEAEDGVYPFTEYALNLPNLGFPLYGNVLTMTGRNVNFRVQLLFSDDRQGNDGVYIRKKVLATWYPWEPFGNYGTKRITDWNQALETGFYKSEENNFINGPVSDKWLVGEVIAHTDRYLKQNVKELQGNREWERRRDAGIWTPWVEISPQLVFQSVSNGKAQVAAAITGKGVSTAADASFATLTNNINAIQTSKRTASGTHYVNTGTTQFQTLAGTTSNEYFVYFNNPFNVIPKYVRVTQSNSTFAYETTFDRTRPSPFNNAMINNFYTTGESTSVTTYSFNATNHITASFIRIPVKQFGVTYEWYIEE